MRRLVGTTAFLCALSWGTLASAQTPEEKETARVLMDRGHERLAAGDPAAALEAFESADELMKVPTTALARGQTLAQLGRLTEAVDVLRRAARFPKSPDEPAAFSEARRQAKRLDESLAERIPALVLTLEPPLEGPTVRIDGRLLSGQVVGQPLRLDPGPHQITVTAPGHLPARGSVELEEGETRATRLTLEPDPASQDDAEPGPAGPDGPGPNPVSPAPPSEGARDEDGVHLVSWVAFGVAGAGLVAGAITGGLSLSRVGELEEQCPAKTGCSEDLRSDHDTMLVLANASNASFALAGAAALVGVVTLFTVESEPEDAEGPNPAPASVRIRPVVGPLGAGFVGTF